MLVFYSISLINNWLFFVLVQSEIEVNCTHSMKKYCCHARLEKNRVQLYFRSLCYNLDHSIYVDLIINNFRYYRSSLFKKFCDTNLSNFLSPHPGICDRSDILDKFPLISLKTKKKNSLFYQQNRIEENIYLNNNTC